MRPRVTFENLDNPFILSRPFALFPYIIYTLLRQGCRSHLPFHRSTSTSFFSCPAAAYNYRRLSSLSILWQDTTSTKALITTFDHIHTRVIFCARVCIVAVCPGARADFAFPRPLSKGSFRGISERGLEKEKRAARGAHRKHGVYIYVRWSLSLSSTARYCATRDLEDTKRNLSSRARARLPFSCIYVCMCAWGEWAKRARGRKKYRVSLFSGTLVGLTLFLRPRPGDVANFALFGHLIFFPPSGDLNSADRAWELSGLALTAPRWKYCAQCHQIYTRRRS